MIEILFDTSVLVEFFEGSERGANVCEAIETGIGAISVLTIAEFSAICSRKQQDPKEQIAFIYRNISVLPVSASACEHAGRFRTIQHVQGKKTSLIDAIIYNTAQEHKLTLLTRDRDFTGLEGVELLG